MNTQEMNAKNLWIEPNNNYDKKFHDPWTRNGSSGKLKETNLLISEDNSHIYKPRNISNRDDDDDIAKQPLTESQRKLSVYHHEPHVGTASFAISVFNLMNAILGSGILGLAYAMAQLGVVLFFTCAVAVAFLALFAIHLLLILCDQSGVKAYEKLGFEAFGLPGRITAALCILLQNIGAMCSYLFIVKYELPNVLMTMIGLEENDGSWYLNGDYLVILVTICIIMPLATFKNIGFLGYTSGFSISCMFFFTVVIIVKKFSIPCPLFDLEVLQHSHDAANSTTSENTTMIPDDVAETITSLATYTGQKILNLVNSTGVVALDNMTEPSWLHPARETGVKELYETYGPQECEVKALELTSRWAYSIPTMTFSFVCHTAVLPIYAELKKPSAPRMQKVANTSVGVCFILYALAALFGYLTFYNWMEAEMLLMYSYPDAANVLTLIVRLTVLIAVVLTVPLTHFPVVTSDPQTLIFHHPTPIALNEPIGMLSLPLVEDFLSGESSFYSQAVVDKDTVQSKSLLRSSLKARKALTFLLFPNKDFKWSIHLGIMAFLLSLINLLVIFVPSIKEVFGIIGATASTMLVFVLPCVFFLKLDPRPFKTPKKIAAAIMCGAGVCLMIESLTVIIIGYFD